VTINLVSQLAPGVHTGYAILPGGIVLYDHVGVGPDEAQEVTVTAHVQPGIGFN
jgi:hypothetical protein